VYEGQVVGQYTRERDLEVNVCKKKHLTNMRNSTAEEAIRLEPPRILSLDDAIEFLADDELLALVPDFKLDKTTAALFGGERLTSYQMPWADTDASLLAIEFDNFAEAILGDREPEVDGAFGLRSLAISYGFLESDRLGRFVSTEELLSSDNLPYQREVEASLAAARG